MTIDDAIEKQEKYISDFEKCKTMHAVTLWEMHCIEERRQLVEWLKDYKRLLEQESCEDVISRQAVHYYIEAHIHEIITESGVDKNGHTNKILRALVNGVDTMPSVTAERTGHWILDESDNSITCDKCGCRIYANDIDNGDAHYCPNCGAKMVEPQESEEV